MRARDRVENLLVWGVFGLCAPLLGGPRRASRSADDVLRGNGGWVHLELEQLVHQVDVRDLDVGVVAGEREPRDLWPPVLEGMEEKCTGPAEPFQEQQHVEEVRGRTEDALAVATLAEREVVLSKDSAPDPQARLRRSAGSGRR